MIFVYFTLKTDGKNELGSIYLKILINFLQLLYIVSRFNIKWPEYIKMLFQIELFPVSSMDQFFSLDCFLSEFTSELYYTKLVSTTLFPLLQALVSLAIWVLIGFKRKDMTVLRNQLITTFLVLFFISQLSIVKYSLSAYSCT